MDTTLTPPPSFPLTKIECMYSCFHSQNAANGPDVHLIAVALLPKHLRSYVVWCAAQRPFPLSLHLHLGSQTKVPQFHLQVLVQEQVTQLEVSVDHLQREVHQLNERVEAQVQITCSYPSPLRGSGVESCLSSLENNVHCMYTQTCILSCLHVHVH